MFAETQNDLIYRLQQKLHDAASQNSVPQHCPLRTWNNELLAEKVLPAGEEQSHPQIAHTGYFFDGRQKLSGLKAVEQMQNYILASSTNFYLRKG